MAFKKLKPEHYIAIGYLSMPKKGGKTMEEIAEECEVHRATIYDWLKDPVFERELKRTITRNTLARLPEVLESIPDHIIRDGNAAMLKHFLQMHSMLSEHHVVTDTRSGDSTNVDAARAKVEEFRKQQQVKAEGNE
ncbi:phBC6A51 family helix-turn-helix protein [Shouchella patagoniensis]|uniref:phBC6A51 family helix-turn-helix protein n=1 Tax=Shouchella patagoniensis TaxID=228576 RepID=UPI00099576F0|nr:phBC6A51 family helix-turn-helix protein [Shouchella patagoniensis]